MKAKWSSKASVGSDGEDPTLMVGITVLRGISLVMTPPVVSIPRVRGSTSEDETSKLSPLIRIPSWTGCTGNGLIGVDSLGRFLSKVLLEELLDLGDTGRTADKDNLTNI